MWEALKHGTPTSLGHVVGFAGAATIVFGVQRVAPSGDAAWYRKVQVANPNS